MLKKHIALASVEPQAPSEKPIPGNETGTNEQDPMDAEARLGTDCPLLPQVRWSERAESDSLHDKDDAHGQRVAGLVRRMFPRTDAEDAAGADTCLAETTWSVRRISDSRFSVHMVLEVWTDEEQHALLQVNSDSGQAFLEASTADAGVAHLAVDKILLGPDYV